MFGAPFFHVNFADFWLADQLNSMVAALLDFQFLVCFYITNGDWMNANSEHFFFVSSFNTQLLFFSCRHRDLCRQEFYHKATGELHTSVDTFCTMFEAIQGLEGSVSAFGKRRQIFKYIFRCHFFHFKELLQRYIALIVIY